MGVNVGSQLLVTFLNCKLMTALCFAGYAGLPQNTVKVHSVQRSTSAINEITNFVVDGHGLGRQRKTWSECIKSDISKFKMSEINPNDRFLWRKNLRTNMVQPLDRKTVAR